MSKLEKLIQKLCPNGIEYKQLSDLIIKNPKSKIGAKKAETIDKGEIPFFTSGKTTYYINEYLVEGENLFVNDGGQADIKYYNGKAHYADHVISFKTTKINGRFLFHYLMKKRDFINENMFRGSGIKNINKNDFFSMLIPIPPLEIQQEIVNILDKFASISTELWNNGTIKWLGSTVCKNKKFVDEVTNYITEIGLKKSSAKLMKKGTTLIAMVGATIGKVAFLNFEATTNQNVACLYPKNEDELDTSYLYYACKNLYFEFLEYSNGKFAIASLGFIKKLEITVPSLEEQQKIVSILDKFDKLTSDISEKLIAEIEARKKQYVYYRDKLLKFKELKV